MPVRRPYAFRGQHLTAIDLAHEVGRHPELRALRNALAQRLGDEAAQEESESVLQQALDEVGEQLVTEVSRDIDALLRTWSRLADDYRSASDRAEMGRIALELADLPGRLEERVRMIPNAGGLVGRAIPSGLVSRLRYPVAAGRVQPEDLSRLGKALKDALPPAIARDLVRVDALDALVRHAVRPLLRGLEVLPEASAPAARVAVEDRADATWHRHGPAELRKLLSAGELTMERVWAPQDPPTPDHLSQCIEDIALSADGTRAVWGRWEPWVHELGDGDSGGARRLGVQDGRAWWRHCLAAAISPDGRRAAAGGASITVFDLASGRVLLDVAEVETEELHAVAFSPCGGLLAAVGASSKVTVFDASTGEERWHVGLEDPAQAVAFSSDGRHVVAGGWTGVLGVHAADTGAKVAAFDDIGGCINGIAVDPTGRWIATAGGCGCASGAPLNPEEVGLRLFDATSGAVVRDMAGHTHPVSRVAIVGQRLLSISDDGTLRAWSLPDGRLVALVDLGLVDDLPTALATAPGGRVMVGSNAGWVASWQLR